MTCTHGEKDDRTSRPARLSSLVDMLVLPDLRGALCASHPVLAASAWDLLVEGESWAQRQGRRALAAQVCAVCPVRQACLQAALAEPAPCGVWAGWLFNPRTGVVNLLALEGVKVQATGGVESGGLGFSVHENPYAA